MGRIIDKYRGKQIYNYVSLNYLNMSLAHKGELADGCLLSIRRNEKLMCRLESDLLHGSFIERCSFSCWRCLFV